MKGGQEPSDIEENPLAMSRLAGIKEDLKKWTAAQVVFEFDPRGTDLFSIIELAYAYAKRSHDLASSIELLIGGGHVVSATIVGRALIETVAMGCLFVSEMDHSISRKNKEKLKKRLTSFWAGSIGTDIKHVHVMDAIRHLDEVDAAYVKYLDEKFPLFKIFAKEFEKTGQKMPPLSETLSAVKNYDDLSEISHPNGIGVHFIYPELEGLEKKIEDDANRLLDRYRFQSLMAIFQCHHLVRTLETTDSLPERYRAAFM
jgi:hypothetical protein